MKLDSWLCYASIFMAGFGVFLCIIEWPSADVIGRIGGIFEVVALLLLSSAFHKWSKES